MNILGWLLVFILLQGKKRKIYFFLNFFFSLLSIDGGMINADIISAEWNTTTNSPEVNDRFSQTEDYPHLDTENGCPNNILVYFSFFFFFENSCFVKTKKKK